MMLGWCCLWCEEGVHLLWKQRVQGPKIYNSKGEGLVLVTEKMENTTKNINLWARFGGPCL